MQAPPPDRESALSHAIVVMARSVLVLVIGLSFTMTLFAAGTLYDATRNTAEVSENATQILTAFVGGTLSLLSAVFGAVFGYRAGVRRSETDDTEPSAPD